MSRRICCVAVCLACGFALIANGISVAAKTPAVKTDPGRSAADRVLRDEIAGQVDRRDRLAGALREIPESSAVRWQAGFVRDGKLWRSFDELPTSQATPGALADYQARRSGASQDFGGQMTLADWCRKQKLVDQERAHLTAALALAPAEQIDPIRQRLGWQRRAGVWFSPEDLQDWQKLNRLTAESLNRWEQKLNQIATGLSGSARQREFALTSLQEIKRPDAIPALELTLAGLSEDMAMAAVVAMRRIEGSVSSLALAKQAVFSQWPEVRQSAAVGLKGRSLDEFVPPLISLLATPVKSELRVTAPTMRRQGGRGQIVFLVSLVLSRETENQFQVAAFNTTNFEINEALNGIRVTGQTQRSLSQMPGVVRAGSDAYRSSFDRTASQQRAVEAINAQTLEMNTRVGDVLATVSGRNATSDAQSWWDWWKAESDTDLAGQKQTVVVTEEYLVGNPLVGYPVDCLVAGTPVWSDQGLRAIEKISVGDRVLAQDVETGELAYKPVLQTTTRPPKELWTVRFNDEALVMTGGHRFWNSGSGWVKARDLESQALLHTVTGNTPVWTAKKGEAAETYNLIVADFHTYFVGKCGILSQDVLTPRGTDCLVPGLTRQHAAASVQR